MADDRLDSLRPWFDDRWPMVYPQGLPKGMFFETPERLLLLAFRVRVGRDKEFVASLSISDTTDLTLSGSLRVVAVEDRTFSGGTSVRDSSDKTLDAKVQVRRSPVILVPNADDYNALNPQVRSSGGGAPWPAVDDSILDPGDPQTLGDGLYAEIASATYYNAAVALFDMTTETLESGEYVKSVTMHLFASFDAVGSPANGRGTVFTQLHWGSGYAYQVAMVSTTTNAALSGAWYTATINFPFAGYSLTQSDIDAIRVYLQLSRLTDSGFNNITPRVHAIYLELEVVGHRTFDAKASIQDTSDKTFSGGASVQDTSDKTFDGKVRVVAVEDREVDAEIRVVVVEDRTAEGKLLVPRTYFFRSPDGDTSAGWDETADYPGQPHSEILSAHEPYYVDDFLNGVVFDPTGLSHLDIDESSGSTPVSSRVTFNTETLDTGERVEAVTAQLYYDEEGTGNDGSVSITIKFWIQGSLVFTSDPQLILVSPGPVSGWVTSSWIPDPDYLVTQSDLDSLEIEIEGVAVGLGGASVHLGLYILKVRVDVSRSKTLDAGTRVVDEVDNETTVSPFVGRSPAYLFPLESEVPGSNLITIALRRERDRWQLLHLETFRPFNFFDKFNELDPLFPWILFSGGGGISSWKRSDADHTPSTLWEALDEATTYPADPSTAGDGLYLYVDSGEAKNDFKFSDLELSTSEFVTGISLFAYVEITDPAGSLQIVFNIASAQLVFDLSGVTAPGWHPSLGELEHLSETGVTEDEINGARFSLYGNAGGGEVRVYSVYAEVTILNLKTFEVEVRVVSVEDLEFQGGVQVQEEVDASFGAIFDIRRWLTVQHLNIGASFRVLIEVDWPGGARRYADVPLAVGDLGYEGRLTSVDPIVQGTDSRRGTVSFTLDNTDHRGSPPETLWSDANPPEGAAVRVYYWFPGDSPEQAIEVFRGVVDSIPNITEWEVGVTAISSEENIDILLGQEINSDDFPDAPPSSLGKMQPIVFGEVEQLEGVPTTQIGVSSLAGTALKADTSISLEDSSRFPTSGTIKLLDETVTYTGKSGNTLTGCSQPRTLDYGPGTPVREIGTLDVMMAAHAATLGSVYAAKGDRVRLLDPSEYTTSLVGPTKVSFSTGWPVVPVPSGGTDFCTPQMEAVSASGNTATNGNNACADHASWSQKVAGTAPSVATVASGQTLKVERASSIPALGDIVRAWAVVEYDGATVGAGTFQLKEGSNTLVSPLSSAGNLSSDLKNRAEALGNTRAYDDTHSIVDPTHSHPAPSAVTDTVFNDNIQSSSGYNNPGRVVDGGLVEAATNINGTTGTMRAAHATALADKGTITAVKGRCRVTNTSGSTCSFRVFVDGVARAGSAGNIANGFDSTITLDASSYAPLLSWTKLVDTSNCYLQFDGPSAGLATVAVGEMWWEVTYSPTATPAGSTGVSQSQNNTPLGVTVATLGDVTSLANGSWSWFQNRAISIVQSSGSASLKVVRVYFLIEFTPTKDETADRILADVTGLAPGGEPTEILEEILTNASLLGLGASSFNSADFSTAAARLLIAAGGGQYRLDFAITEKVRSIELILAVARQSRLLAWWEEGALCVVFEELRADMGDPIAVYQPNDTGLPGVKRSRTVLREVVTRISGRYRYDYRERTLSAVVISETGSERPEEEEWPLIRDEDTAQSLADYSIDRRAIPRFMAEWNLPLIGLEIRRGDIVGIKTARFEYRRAQVVRLAPQGKTVAVSVMIWDDL